LWWARGAEQKNTISGKTPNGVPDPRTAPQWSIAKIDRRGGRGRGVGSKLFAMRARKSKIGA